MIMMKIVMVMMVVVVEVVVVMMVVVAVVVVVMMMRMVIMTMMRVMVMAVTIGSDTFCYFDVADYNVDVYDGEDAEGGDVADEERASVMMLEPGKVFGEIALMSEDCKRKGRCTALKHSELLSLHRHDFQTVGVSQENGVRERAAFLRCVEEGLLEDMSYVDLQAMAGNLTEKSYVGEHEILQQGAEVDRVIFVKSGFCKLVRQLHPKCTEMFCRYAHYGDPMPNPFAASEEGLRVGQKGVWPDQHQRKRRPKKSEDSSANAEAPFSIKSLAGHQMLKKVMPLVEKTEEAEETSPAGEKRPRFRTDTNSSSSAEAPSPQDRGPAAGQSLQVVVDIISKGSSVGVMELMEGLTYQCTVISAPLAEIYSISKFDFIRAHKTITHRLFCNYKARLSDSQLIWRLVQKYRWDHYKKGLLSEIRSWHSSASRGIIDREDPAPMTGGSSLGDETCLRVGRGEKLWDARAQTPPNATYDPDRAVKQIFHVECTRDEDGKPVVTVDREQRDASMDDFERKLQDGRHHGNRPVQRQAPEDGEERGRWCGGGERCFQGRPECCGLDAGARGSGEEDPGGVPAGPEGANRGTASSSEGQGEVRKGPEGTQTLCEADIAKESSQTGLRRSSECPGANQPKRQTSHGGCSGLTRARIRFLARRPQSSEYPVQVPAGRFKAVVNLADTLTQKFKKVAPIWVSRNRRVKWRGITEGDLLVVNAPAPPRASWVPCPGADWKLTGPEMAGADGERGAIPKQAREQPREQQLFFDNVNPATRLLEKRRQMYEVQDALENQKARFAKEEDQFRKKEEQLRDLQLQNQLVKFNKFLQDNEAKRQRSEKRAAEEAAQIKQKDEEILDLEKQLEDSRALCDKLEDEKNRNMKYEDSVLPSSLVEIWRLDDDDDDDDGDAQNQRHDSSLSSVQEASLLRARCPQAVTPVEDGNSRWGMHRAPLPGDLSHVLLMEMQKMVDKLQEKMSEELRREMRDMRELMFAEEPGQRPMFASKSISKASFMQSHCLVT
eukprot:s1212_g4.t2